jgi:membrane peptidoglycan carboxypeptidase
VERGYVQGAEATAMAYPGAEIQAPSETRASRLTYDGYHVKQQVLAELEHDGFPLSRLQQGNLIVQTTLDRGAQAAARTALADRLKGEPQEFRGGLVSVDPSTGAVRAYDGGDDGVRDYAGSEHAAGSAFYPLTLAAGLRAGISPDSPMAAPERVSFLGEDFVYPDRCAKPCTLRSAMASGADTPFIGLAGKIGPDALSATARDAGIPEAIDGVPTLREKDGYLIGSGLAVGRYPLRPLDLAGAYASFADGGLRTTPHLVEKVLDQDGEVVWQHDNTAKPAFGADPNASKRIADGVTGVLQTILPDGRPAALRTGEFQHGDSTDNQDGWAIGYTPQLVTAVWIGSDDDRRLFDAKGAKLVGATVPADIWRAFMVQAHKSLPVRGNSRAQLPPGKPVQRVPGS